MAQEKGIRWGWIVFGLIAVAIASLLVLSQQEDTFEYYMTVSEYRADQQKYIGSKVKIAGHVKPGSLKTSEGQNTFVIEDRGSEINVVYSGLLPDTFKENLDVVVDGRGAEGDQIEAKSVLAKCASKYQADGLPPLEQMRSRSKI